MNRTEARALWQRVADGDTDADLLRWLHATAARLLDADDSGAAARPDAIVRACGLAGALDTGADLRDRLDTMLDFPLLDAEGNEREPLRGEVMRSLIAVARTHSPAWDHLSDDEVRKRIGRMFARK